MLMFVDTIFVSMSKSHRHNDTVDQQERERHLRPYLYRESIHHRFGHLTLWRDYIIAMLHVHHYIVSPETLFRVLWRTHFKNRRISSHGYSSSRLRHLHQQFVRLSTSPWFIMTIFMFFSFDRIFVCGYVLSLCMCVCMRKHGGQSYFSLFRMKTLTTLSFWRAEKIWILWVGKIFNIFSFMWMWKGNSHFFTLLAHLHFFFLSLSRVFVVEKLIKTIKRINPFLTVNNPVPILGCHTPEDWFDSDVDI